MKDYLLTLTLSQWALLSMVLIFTSMLVKHIFSSKKSLARSGRFIPDWQIFLPFFLVVLLSASSWQGVTFSLIWIYIGSYITPWPPNMARFDPKWLTAGVMHKLIFFVYHVCWWPPRLLKKMRERADKNNRP